LVDQPKKKSTPPIYLNPTNNLPSTPSPSKKYYLDIKNPFGKINVIKHSQYHLAQFDLKKYCFSSYSTLSTSG
jgi:hypothetical protein